MPPRCAYSLLGGALPFLHCQWTRLHLPVSDRAIGRLLLPCRRTCLRQRDSSILPEDGLPDAVEPLAQVLPILLPARLLRPLPRLLLLRLVHLGYALKLDRKRNESRALDIVTTSVFVLSKQVYKIIARTKLFFQKIDLILC